METDLDLGLLNISELVFSVGKKVKPIRVKPINVLMTDETVLNNFLLATLEGSQMLRANSMVCIGPTGDVWQQTADKLHKQYVPETMDQDGWVTYRPRPENERDVCEVTIDKGEKGCWNLPQGVTKFSIEAQWGERQSNGKFIQTGFVGDYVVRSKEDPTDVWIVAKSVFENTYELI